MVLKLSTAAPIKARKWVWIRPGFSASRNSTSTSSSSRSGIRLAKAKEASKLPTTKSSSFSLSLYTTYHPCPKPNHRFVPAIYIPGWWRISPYAPFEHDKGPPLNLGFTFPPYHHHPHHHHSSFSVSSSSSSSYSSSSSSDSPPSADDRGGFVADMGSENKGQDWYPNGMHQNQSQTISPLHHHHHHHQQQRNSSKLLTLPTILTLGRVASVPLLIGTFYVDGWWGTTATTSIFIAAAITDWLDGYLARKMRLGSAFGAFLDPVADKLMVAATLVLLCTQPLNAGAFGQVPWLLTVPAIAIIGREITMSAVREWAASQNGKLLEAVAVNNLGKWKTATQMTALTILLVTRDSSLGGPGILVASGVVLLYISAGLAVWSLIVYMSKIWRVLLK